MLVRCFMVVLFGLCAATVWGQENVVATSSFTISGKVKASRAYSLDEIRKMQTQKIGDVSITNHKGEVKGVAKNLQGVLLRDLLSGVELDAESPKVFSEFYFVCVATDGYKVVYSWNELFNTATGKTTYIVTAKETGDKKSNDDILMISTQDSMTGRRYLKNLQAIEVRRAE